MIFKAFSYGVYMTRNMPSAIRWGLGWVHWAQWPRLPESLLEANHDYNNHNYNNHDNKNNRKIIIKIIEKL